jgi:hypothetical protein
LQGLLASFHGYERRRMLARTVVLDREQIADGLVALGDAVELAHGRTMRRFETAGEEIRHVSRLTAGDGAIL